MRRYFLLIPLLFVLGPASLFASMDSGLLSMVPPDAKVVTSIDVMRARSSEFGQYILNKTQNDNHDFADFVRQTGFDPRTDLQSIVFESSGPATDGSQSRFAILARGNFDADRILELAKTKRAAVQTYQGVKLLFPDGDESQRASAVAFPDPGIAIVADLATIHQILANRSIPSQLDPALQQKIEQVANGNDAWFVSLTGGGFLRHHAAGEKNGPPAQAMQALQSIVTSSGGIRFGNTVDLTIDATARSAQDATSLQDVVRFLGSMLQMQRQNDPRAAILASALDNMSLAVQGNNVHLAVSIPEKSMEQLAALGPASHPGHQPK
jgi:hypothetical protein